MIVDWWFDELFPDLYKSPLTKSHEISSRILIGFFLVYHFFLHFRFTDLIYIFFFLFLAIFFFLIKTFKIETIEEIYIFYSQLHIVFFFAV
jgi:hypothetical protein